MDERSSFFTQQNRIFKLVPHVFSCGDSLFRHEFGACEFFANFLTIFSLSGHIINYGLKAYCMDDQRPCWAGTLVGEIGNDA
jgi:hypothetical protein